jgi:hypothetical protein
LRRGEWSSDAMWFLVHHLFIFASRDRSAEDYDIEEKRCDSRYSALRVSLGSCLSGCDITYTPNIAKAKSALYKRHTIMPVSSSHVV